MTAMTDKKTFMRAGLAIAAMFFGAAACASASAGDRELSERALKKLAKFEPTGEVQTCLSTVQIRSIDPIDDNLFLIEATGGKYYLNEVSGRCNGASRSGNRLQYTLSMSQLCRNEIIHVVDNSSGFTVGSCGLGSFERLNDAPPETDDEQDASE